jgi:hypothetical protein
MDLLGVTRTIDHAVYTLLNALAIILWRVDSALMGISLLSYRTQDWLTGPDGGVWRLLARLVGVDGIFGLELYQVMLVLALTLFGLSRILRPFFRNLQPVDPGRMLFFAIIAYVFITQGSELLHQAEGWRGEAGGYVYQALSTGESVDLGSLGSGTDLLYAPQDLDGQPPIRAWEAVATSYFLAGDNDDLHAGVPPEEFRRAYCLYDPAVPVDQQTQENAEGCSPRKAWDEWDMLSTQPITQVWGIPLPIDISLSLPIVEEHPENRQQGIRQAQQGVARLALGPVVALFPILEANVGLMLALSASFIYLSLPITLLFGFFLFTEPMVTRLFMQFIGLFIRTLILNGLLALFMVVLMGVAANGSLTIYLGLVGIGLVGGIFLTRLAAATMRETLSMSLSAMGGVWMGATTGVLGEGARRPAQAALGLAKLGAAAGVTYAAGKAGVQAGAVSAAADLLEPVGSTARAGWDDLRGRSPREAQSVMRHGHLPPPLARLVAGEAQRPALDPLSPVGGMPAAAAPAVPLPAGWTGQGGERPASHPIRGTSPADFGAAWSVSTAPDGKGQLPADGSAAARRDERAVDAWVAQMYQAGARGQRQALETGSALVGEEVSREALRAMNRHSQEEAMAVLRATRQAAAEVQARSVSPMRPDGILSPEVLQAVRGKLDGRTMQAFAGAGGERDLAALVATGLQARKEARPEDFRRAMAQAPAGQGEGSPGRTVPRSLGLAPVAAGQHFAAMNRFARLSEQAGLSQEQRQQLLREVGQNGKVSQPLRREIEAAIRKQGDKAAGLSVEDLEARAQALPPTLRGPVEVHLPGKTGKSQSDQDRPGQTGSGHESNKPQRDGALTGRRGSRSSRQVTQTEDPAPGPARGRVAPPALQGRVGGKRS